MSRIIGPAEGRASVSQVVENFEGCSGTGTVLLFIHHQEQSLS